MRESSFADHNCSLARALAEVGDGWTLLILRNAFQGERTFEELQRNLGVARNTLTDRLKKLVSVGLLDQIDIGKRGTRYEYVLTEKAADLLPTLVALMQWGDRWLSGRGAEPVLLKNRRDATLIEPVAIHDKKGRKVAADDVIYTPGPGADARTRAYFNAQQRKPESRVLTHSIVKKS
jgi:DNA-binding HxlR family transcriptional regulator